MDSPVAAGAAEQEALLRMSSSRKANTAGVHYTSKSVKS
jgi:hypothetical protein